MKRKIIKKFFKIFICIALCTCFCVGFIFYSPFTKKWRNIYITTAMTTMKHQYLATWFFNKNTIKGVMYNNRVIDNGEKSKIEEIKVIKPQFHKIIKKTKIDKNSDLDLLEKIDLEENGYKGYLLKVRDPSKVFLGCTKDFLEHGQKLNKIAKNYNAIAGINSGGFVDRRGHGNGGTPFGLVIINSKIIYKDNSKKYNVIGLNKNNILVLGKYTINKIKQLNLRDAVTFSPNLVLNGKPTRILGNGGGGLQPRTGIAQKKDGTILMLVIDGRQFSSTGTTYREIQNIFLKYGAYNAAILDGGSSTTMYYKGKIINHPCGPIGARYLPNAFLVRK